MKTRSGIWPRRLAMPFALAAAVATPLPAAAADPTFEYVGMFGELYPVRTESSIIGLNERGEFAGSSRRAAGVWGIYTAWIGDPSGATRLVGFYDVDHTSPTTGEYSSHVGQLNENGIVIGVSGRHLPAPGSTAWWANAQGQTTRLGLLDGAHTSSSGAQRSHVFLLNEDNVMAGHSAIYSGADEVGQTVWLAHTSGWIFPAGLYDAAHRRGGTADGAYYSDVQQLTESGFAAGISTSFPALGVEGLSAWIADVSSRTTTRVGFYDADHTGPSGLQRSWVSLNQLGDMVGLSFRFVGDGGVDPDGFEVLGQSAWIGHVTGGITRIGLLDATHTASDGFQYSAMRLTVTESGYAAGHSYRFDHGLTPVDGSRSAWIANRTGVTQRIGLYDSERTSTDGFTRNEATHISEAGIAAGEAMRFIAGENRGTTTWLATFDGTTVPVGLYDAEHTSADGWQISRIAVLAPNGVAVGFSNRPPVWWGDPGRTYWWADHTGRTVLIAEGSSGETVESNAAGFVWTRSWVHDTNTGVTWRPDIAVLNVTDDGLVLGTIGFDRAAVWVPGRGTFNIEQNLDVSVTSEGWELLRYAEFANRQGYIVGRGLVLPNGGPPARDQAFMVRMVPPYRPGPLEPKADVVVQKDQDVFRCGKAVYLRYTITIGNLGPDKATGVLVRDRLPEGAMFVCAYAARGTLQTPRQWYSGDIVWRPGDLAAEPHAVSELVIWAAVTKPGLYLNRAWIRSDAEDPDPTNNRDYIYYRFKQPPAED